MLQAAQMTGNTDVFGDTKKSWTATIFFFFFCVGYKVNESEIVALEYNNNWNNNKKREKKSFCINFNLFFLWHFLNCFLIDRLLISKVQKARITCSATAWIISDS